MTDLSEIGDRTDDTFLHLQLSATSDLVELAEHFRQARRQAEAAGNRTQIDEVRISITQDALGSQVENGNGQENENLGPNQIQAVVPAQDDQNSRRISQFLLLLKALLQTARDVEKLTFDSGFTRDTNVLPLQAVGVVISEATALKRLDLSYVQVTCYQLNELDEWKCSVQNSSSDCMATWQTLTHCCLDRCSFALQRNSQTTTSISLDGLICFMVESFPCLEWLTICCDETVRTLNDTTLTQLCQAPKLQELMLWNFELPHLRHFFDTLSQQSDSQLTRLTIPTSLSLAGAQAVARYLRLSKSTEETNPMGENNKRINDGLPRKFLQGLTLTVNQFVRHDDSDHGRLMPLTMEQDRQEIYTLVTVLANALSVNTSLQSFRLRGSSKFPLDSHKLFAQAIARNYSLLYFSILNDTHPVVCDVTATTDSSSNSNQDGDTTTAAIAAANTTKTIRHCRDNIQMYLRLNRHGRRHLLLGNAGKEPWMTALAEFRKDLNCLFYLLQTNPSLCSLNEPQHLKGEGKKYKKE